MRCILGVCCNQKLSVSTHNGGIIIDGQEITDEMYDKDECYVYINKSITEKLYLFMKKIRDKDKRKQIADKLRLKRNVKMTDTYKKKVDDFLRKTGAQLLLLKDDGVPHTVIMVRDNKSMSVLKVRAYTQKEQTTYDFFKRVQAYAHDLNLVSQSRSFAALPVCCGFHSNSLSINSSVNLFIFTP